jgi:hypothetical protein
MMTDIQVATNDRDDVEAEFRRVMAYATERACTDGLEEDVMAALFGVLVGVGEDDGGDP